MEIKNLNDLGPSTVPSTVPLTVTEFGREEALKVLTGLSKKKQEKFRTQVEEGASNSSAKDFVKTQLEGLDEKYRKYIGDLTKMYTNIYGMFGGNSKRKVNNEKFYNKISMRYPTLAEIMSNADLNDQNRGILAQDLLNSYMKAKKGKKTKQLSVKDKEVIVNAHNGILPDKTNLYENSNKDDESGESRQVKGVFFDGDKIGAQKHSALRDYFVKQGWDEEEADEYVKILLDRGVCAPKHRLIGAVIALTLTGMSLLSSCGKQDDFTTLGPKALEKIVALHSPDSLGIKHLRINEVNFDELNMTKPDYIYHIYKTSDGSATFVTLPGSFLLVDHEGNVFAYDSNTGHWSKVNPDQLSPGESATVSYVTSANL